MGTVHSLPIVPRNTARLTTLCHGDAITQLATRAIAEMQSQHGTTLTAAFLKREIIKLECVAGSVE